MRVGFLVGQNRGSVALPNVGCQRIDRKGNELHADDVDHGNDTQRGDPFAPLAAHKQNRRDTPAANQQSYQGVDHRGGNAHAVTYQRADAEIEILPLNKQHQGDGKTDGVGDVKHPSPQREKQSSDHSRYGKRPQKVSRANAGATWKMGEKYETTPRSAYLERGVAALCVKK